MYSWKTLPTSLAVFILMIGAGFFFGTPQILAVAATTSWQGLPWPRLNPITLMALWLRTDPTVVTGAVLPPAVHWTVAVVTVLVLAALALIIVVIVVKWKNNPERTRGLASVIDVKKEMGTRALEKKFGRKLRPSIKRPTAAEVGMLVGSFQGEDVWLRVEDPTIVIGPSRAGKGLYFVLNWILNAQGAVITTTSKMENAQSTAVIREHHGSPVRIFAPGVEGGDGMGRTLKWDPVQGCDNEKTLTRRVKALIPSDAFSGSTSNGGHWDTLGQQLASHLFHAAALANASVATIWEWVGNPTRALDAVRIIREHPKGLRDHANHLESVINMPPEQRSTQWGVLPTSLAFLDSGAAREWMMPVPDERVDLVDFILDRGTLYLVGDEATSGGYTRIIAGLLAEIDYITKGLADASPGSRLDPPVSYILDEAGNFEYPGMYELITAGGGRGRIAFAMVQARAQLQQWGQEKAEAMWDAAAAKIILPGGADEQKLRGLSELVGDLWVQRTSITHGGHGPASLQVSEEKRNILEVSQIREMQKGHALLFYRHLKPIVIKLNPFTEHADYAESERQHNLAAEKMQAASPFADKLRSRAGGQRA